MGLHGLLQEELYLLPSTIKWGEFIFITDISVSQNQSHNYDDGVRGKAEG
jgi:hypothetical protein